jgi:hypothetical protein
MMSEVDPRMLARHPANTMEGSPKLLRQIRRFICGLLAMLCSLCFGKAWGSIAHDNQKTRERENAMQVVTDGDVYICVFVVFAVVAVRCICV